MKLSLNVSFLIRAQDIFALVQTLKRCTFFSVEDRTINSKKSWFGFTKNKNEEKDFFNFRVIANSQVTYKEDNTLIVLTPNGVLYKYIYSFNPKDNSWNIEQEWRCTV